MTENRFMAADPWKNKDVKISRAPRENDGGIRGKIGAWILTELAEIIRNWPMENTASMNDEERHLRFVQSIAGYPEIDIGIRPLDSPLHPKAINALEVSKLLDDLSGICENQSLRTSILNRDLKSRTEKLQKLKETHEECLLLLFARLRQIDGILIPEAEDNSVSFRNEEIDFLRALHSTVRKTNWWPKLRKLSNYCEEYSSESNKPDMTKYTYGSEEFNKAKEEAEYHKKWKNIVPNFLIPENMIEVTFQFHYIQKFIDRYGIPEQRLPGTKQRFIRGYSLLLELITSELIQRISSEIGIGAIVIHGGGRVSFLCDPKDFQNDDFLSRLGLLGIKKHKGIYRRNGKDQHPCNLVELFLSTDSKAINNIRFRTILKNWAEQNLVEGQGINNEGIEVMEKLPLGSQKDFRHWFRQLSTFIPPMSVSHTGESTPSSEDLLSDMQRISSPVIHDYENKYDNCVFCNDSEITDKDTHRIDAWIGLNRSENNSNEQPQVCPSHRLIYFLGHDQRVKDSAYRIGSEVSEKITMKDKIKQFLMLWSPKDNRVTLTGSYDQKVTGIVRLDCNSLGVIFRENYESSFSSSDNQIRRIRRSFRFNYLWWNNLRKSLDKFTSKQDTEIGAWVTAGDDIILAQYQTLSNTDELEQYVVSDNLSQMVTDFAQRLHSESIDGDIFLSIGIGLAMSREKERIDPQLQRAAIFEHKAKRIWKTKAEKNWEKMMKVRVLGFEDKFEIKEFKPLEGNIDYWIGEKSVIISDFNYKEELKICSKCNKYRENCDCNSISNEDIELEFQDWDNSFEEIKARLADGDENLSLNTLEYMRKRLMRHYFTIHENERKTLTILAKKEE